jgi:hypothetical protein
MTRTVQKEEPYEYKYLDDLKVYAAIKEATTVDELISLLKVLQEDDDTESDHMIADDIVLKALRILGQDELVDEYEKVEKWYS